MERMFVLFLGLGLLSLSAVCQAAVIDQAALDNCLCTCSCAAYGWSCGYNVGCSYYPGDSGDPPDTSCGRLNEGPCRCSGGGCQRVPMPADGSCYVNCQNQYGEPPPAKCGDNICEPGKGENCGNCASDCACLPTTETCAVGDSSSDARGCKSYTPPECGDGICQPVESVNSCPADCHKCGDGICSSPYENYDVCPTDCNSYCGDGYCNGNEDSSTCPEDCGSGVPYPQTGTSSGSGSSGNTPDYSGASNGGYTPPGYNQPSGTGGCCVTQFILPMVLVGALTNRKKK